MATYFLDTSVIIDVLNGKNDRGKLLQNLLEQGSSLACCSINIAEIYAGLRKKEEERTRIFLESLECLELSWSIARQAGLLKRDYLQRGQTLTLSDTLIAATAIHYGCTLITDNHKDFPMRELSLYPMVKNQ